MRNFILFHMLFFPGGVLLFFGATSVTMRVEGWAKRVFGQFSRLASAV